MSYINLLFLIATTIYHVSLNQIERRKFAPPGKLISVNNKLWHFYCIGEGNPVIVLDHSLGGLDGYFLVEEIAKIARVFIYDRAGYGWSDSSDQPRTSQQIVNELDTILTQAQIEPPYILVGDSFGSYNMRLYAQQFPEKVIGMVLTDGLHEAEMLNLPLNLKLLKLFLLISFLLSQAGAALGIVRFLGTIGVFELIKPELRKFSPETLKIVKRSFYQSKHWGTMAREIWSLDKSSRQLYQANSFDQLPIILIKATTFLPRSLVTFFFPLKAASQAGARMQSDSLKLSTNCQQLLTTNSSHFVWIDEPEVILEAIRELLAIIKR